MVQYSFVLFPRYFHRREKERETSPTESCAQWGTQRVVGSSCGHFLWIRGKFTWLIRADRETCMPTPRHLHILFESTHRIYYFLIFFKKQTPRKSIFTINCSEDFHQMLKGLCIIRHTEVFTLNTSVVSAHHIKSQLKAAAAYETANNTNHISQHGN